MERAPGGMLDTTMRLLMRKNSVYMAFIFTGAIIGERVRVVLVGSWIFVRDGPDCDQYLSS